MIKTLFALLIFSGALQAQEEIKNLSKTTPGDAKQFMALRDAFDNQSLPALRSAAAPDQWTRVNWVQALAAEAVRLRLEEPDLAKTLDRPRGLIPEVYESFRKPTPLCLRQFRHIGIKGIPLLLERWRWTFDEYPFSEGEKGEKEEMAFRQAILAAAGQTGDRRAQYFLEEIARQPKENPRWRSEAAVSLGMCAGEEALPVLLDLLDGTTPLEVKKACARALGRIPSVKAVQAIQTRLGNPGIDPSLITALGILGSKWGWDARGAENGVEIRKQCSNLLVSQISRVPELAEPIGKAIALVAWPESLDQIERMSDNPAARAILPLLRRTLER